jgi:hypothetical protein
MTDTHPFPPRWTDPVPVLDLDLPCPVQTFRLGQRVRKKSGSSWHGRIVGTYRTVLTDEGYCVESEREPGSVQIYPAHALMAVPE